MRNKNHKTFMYFLCVNNCLNYKVFIREKNYRQVLLQNKNKPLKMI